jgi:hypothetical protein
MISLKGLLAEAADDNIGLWEFASDARAALPDGSQEDVLALVVDILTPLLLGRLVEAGDYSGPGTKFQPWDLAPQASLDRIQAFWRNLGRDPTLGDNVYFVATTLGCRWIDLLD